MWEQVALFLDYKTIRRRIEHQLANTGLLIGHIFLFLAVLSVLSIYYFKFVTSYREFFGDPTAGSLMTLWSIGLALHGLWTYTRSGAVYRNRTRAIESELRERLEQDDTELLTNPKQAFRIQSLLDDDIRQRSTFLLPLLGWHILNAAAWVWWAVYYHSSTTHAWQLIAPISITFLLWVLGLQWRANRAHDRQLAELLSQRPANKQKRIAPDFAEAIHTLADDDPLVDFPDTEYPINGHKTKR